jgi:transcription initiation factor TFIIH subunit 4
MLGSLKLGRRYETSRLSKVQLGVLEDLRQLGLVHQHSASDSGFYPTRLATTLTSSASVSASSSHDVEPTGFVILETNYRVYAYTSNSLQLAILNLFVSLRNRFPNLAIGTITRESVKAALANGINAEQVLYTASLCPPSP